MKGQDPPVPIKTREDLDPSIKYLWHVLINTFFFLLNIPVLLGLCWHSNIFPIFFKFNIKIGKNYTLSIYNFIFHSFNLFIPLDVKIYLYVISTINILSTNIFLFKI